MIPTNNLQDDFKEFMADPWPISSEEGQALLKLKSRLFPNPWKVFGKLVLLHGVIGLLSLSICRQFGLNPFGTEFTLTDWFMRLGGHRVCMVLCGVLFTASTYIFANIILTLEELESVKSHKWLETTIVSFASLAAFYFLGAELVTALTILWLGGSLLGGVLSVESSYYLRRALS